MELGEQALTPGAIRCPQKTAPVGGTMRGKRPGTPRVRSASLMMPRRYGSFYNLSQSSSICFFGIASHSSACNLVRIGGFLRTL